MSGRVGQQLGQYRLTRLLGRGGFAEVYLGEHVLLAAQAAIKVLHTQLADEDDRSSFLKEARTIAHLIHPHIIRVFDFDVENSVPFLVVDYAPNGTLRQRHPKGTQLSLQIVVHYVKQVADALQYAHDEKVIHRDIKPENMLISRRNELLLSDFGIATVAMSSRSQNTQDIAGTMAYMAPEQIQAHPRPASDQYSLAVVAYEWLSGSRPFQGTAVEIAAKHIHTSPLSLCEKLPALPPAVNDVILTALAKDPKQRFASINAFATALYEASQIKPNTPVVSQPIPPPISPSFKPSLPPSTLLTRTEFAQLVQPEPLYPELESSKETPKPVPTMSEPVATKIISSRKRLSAGRAALLSVLILIIIGSGSLVYRMVNTNIANLQVQATATANAQIGATATVKAYPIATAIAAENAYNAYVTAHGMMFGFDVAHSRINPFEKVLNTSNVGQLIPVWSYTTGDAVGSSPAVVNGVVYVGSGDHSLYALDAGTGNKLWSYATGGSIGSSPAVVNGVVYVGSNDGKVYAFRLP
jgi:serine/threonine protein kinase